MSNLSQKPNNAEEIAKQTLALIAKDPDFIAVHHFMEYVCAALDITGEELIDAGIDIEKKSGTEPVETKPLPEVVVGYDVLHECLEDKLKSMCVVLPEDMTMERLVADFAEYCSSDVHEWLKDNLKSFVERYDFPSKFDREEEK
jgi:hypothetical protein